VKNDNQRIRQCILLAAERQVKFCTPSVDKIVSKALDCP
jgi:hypothetical protein